MKMNYITIKPNDIANGPGVRVSLFVSGCTLKCLGCFNEEAQCFFAGQPFTEDTIQTILDYCNKPYIQGLSILGGDPFEPSNQPYVLMLLERFRLLYKESKDVWLWTGRIYERELTEQKRDYLEGTTKAILELTDILVDGRFILQKHKKGLKFMGSTNQRVIDVPSTLKANKVILSSKYSE